MDEKTAKQLAKELLESGSFPEQDLSGDMQNGVYCGLEDICAGDRYEGADYGYSEGVARCHEWLKNMLEEYVE